MNRDSKLHGGTHVLQTPPGENDQWTYEKRTHWWEADALKSWFLSKGYTLYNRTRVDGEPTRFMFPACGKEPDEHSFPYAHQHSNVIDDDWVQGPSFTTWCGYRNVIVYAQDSQGRHVAIKAVKDRSEEYQILRYLKEHLIPTTMDDFENVLPVLELLSYNEYWFAVMPRWGDVPLRPLARTMEEILQIIHALLKGLNCLHKHKIAHLDIKADNILVSHFGKRLTDGNNEFRATLRSQGRLTYAFFDFDVAAIFPPTCTLEECRLHYRRSWRALGSQVPADTSHGELDFDPFAFDVGMLGVLFCREFQHLTPEVPMLAPFFDRMITRNIPQRFTASEALRFFEEQVYPRTTESQLKVVPTMPKFCSYDMYDRWAGLEQTFVQEWAAFREPPVPWRDRVLRSICAHIWGYRLIASFRKVFQFLRMYIPPFHL